jgi:predicted RNA binding protein YcfA (HicA-like mRNA interferase family)
VKYRDFLKILIANDFTETRCTGDHHQYSGVVDGKPQMVTAAFKQAGEDIQKNNLASMIRQSGLPKKLFR